METRVHNDYPWIIPFSIRLISVPLHLWTVKNMKNIGSRLGHVDTLELTEDCMLIDVDTRRPLKFSRKAESPEGDEVTLEIKYEMLFKHCSSCGMLTHEKEYCPATDVKSGIQQPVERPGVFTWMQHLLELSRNQAFSRDHRLSMQQPLHSSLQRTDMVSRLGYTDGNYDMEEHYSRYHDSHSDRIMEVEDPQAGEMMECEVENDDLLGMDLKESEDNAVQQDQNKVLARPHNKASRSRIIGPRMNVPLGFPIKKN